MHVGIMQPYFFPYIGYYQLINSVDTFIIYDDVNFIKQGWINRNRILLNGKAFMVNLILNGASSFKLINQVEVGQDQQKLVKTLVQAYRKAPYFEQVFPLIHEIITFDEKNLAKYLTFGISKLVEYAKMNVQLLVSSDIDKDNELKGEEKIIDICLKQKATKYINAIGGQNLYSKEKFNAHGLELNFIKTQDINYPQFKNDFIPGLSVIDVLMFNSITQIQNYLNRYELL